MSPAPRLRLPRLTRDGMIFAVATAMLINEVFLSSKADPTIVYAAVGLYGVPVVLRADEGRRRQNGDTPPRGNPPAPVPRGES